MKHFFLIITLLLLTCLSFAQTQTRAIYLAPTDNPVPNQKRKAVVIGMSNYDVAGAKLENTLNDADDMAKAFAQLGFDVTKLEDMDFATLRNNLETWYNSIEGNDMAVFYYSGHGMEIDGDNYLLPKDFSTKYSKTDAKSYSLSVANVAGNMEEKHVGMKLIILDACRETPSAYRSWSQARGISENGLAEQKNVPRGIYIAFATAPGSLSLDGGNLGLKNGVFTHYLKQEILTPGYSIDDILNTVSGDVQKLTQGEQIPYKTGSMTGTLYFIPGNKPIIENPDDPTILLRKANVLSKNKQYPEAFTLYQKAANQGNAAGQNNLGLCYENGYGVTKDLNQAIAWYKKAADQGNLNAQAALDRLQNNPPLKPVDVAVLVRQADKYSDNGQYDIAYPFYKQAADQGNAYAQFAIGYCYEEGMVVTKDYNQAVEWYQKAANQGYEGAQNRLGICYEEGKGVTQDYNQAAYWYQKAANQGNSGAQTNLGACYILGQGVTKNYSQAVYWYQKAADKGETLAEKTLAGCYEKGLGVTKDINQAIYWYKKAADQGDAESKDSLKRLRVNYP